MAGPKCAHFIRCNRCGRRVHKGIPKCAGCRWVVSCLTDNWGIVYGVKSRTDAMRLFRLHKNDAEEMMSEPIQAAMAALREARLI